MNTVFALVLNVILNTGEPVDLVTSLYNSLNECKAAAAEQ
ncbi:DUF1482 family protein, partial [Escherichia coli]|nr:DUF1482 family protein [Escherichia coli]